MRKCRRKINSMLMKRVVPFALALAMIISGLQMGSINALAAETSTWKSDVTAAMDELDAAMGAADDYAEALTNLQAALDGLEMAVAVEDLKVTAVGEDYVVLQWLPPADASSVTGYNVYWADKDLDTTKFQLIGADGYLAENMSGTLDENGKKIPGDTMTMSAEEAAGKDVIEFKVNMSTFNNNYFKVAVVTATGEGTLGLAVEAPTAVEYQAVLDELGRGLVATQKSNGVYLNWRLTWDELDGGWFEDETGEGLTGLNFNVYKNGEKLATVTNSTNYLDTTVTSGLTQDMYYIIPVDADGNELTEEKAEIYQVLTMDSGYDAAYLQFTTYPPASYTIGEKYGVTETAYNNQDTVITYAINDSSATDVDGDGEYEILVKWSPSNAKDVSQWGYTGTQVIDCYKIDGTLLWRVDMGINIRAGAHYTQHLAFDFEGDGQGEMIVKTAPGTKTISYELDANGKNVLDENGYPKVAEESYITIPADDVAAGVTDETSYVCTPETYEENLVEMFMQWGVWENYPEATREYMLEYWPTNLVECFSISAEWGDKSFYTHNSSSAALDVSTMTTADIQAYVPNYEEGDLLVPVALEIPTTETDRTSVARNAQLMTVLVEEVKDYTGGYDLASVSKDVAGVGYTRAEAEILAGYFMDHYGYTNYRHITDLFEGFIITGPEYITLFDAKTGKELDTQDYAIAREDDGLTWGDYGWFGGKEPGNRVDRFNATVAYLDGETPSAVFGRGYYARTAFEVWNVVDGKLELVDTADSGPQMTTNPFNDNGAYANGIDPEFGKMSGQGQHYITVVDANLDGRQEIINGGAIVTLDKETNGLKVYNAGGDYLAGDENNVWKKHYHGDMMHITDIDPDLPGIEIASCFEGGSGPYGWAVRTLYTNNTLFGGGTGSDIARFTIGDTNSDVRGIEIVSGGTNASGEKITIAGSNNTNQNIKWAADMTTQFISGAEGSDVNIIGLKTFLKGSGYTTGNSTKGNPALVADLLGDSREELIVGAKDGKSIRIYMNAEVSTVKNYTLMQNLQYRAHVSSQQSAYNMPSYTDYYYAYDTDWEYVTIPNREADQAPGEVATTVELSAESFALVRNAIALASEGVQATTWEEFTETADNLRAKMFFMEDDSTPLDFDIPLVNKLMATFEQAEAVKTLPLLDTTAGDAIYAEAAAETTDNKYLYTEASVTALVEAMAAYDAVKGNMDVTPELAALQETISYWLQDVDTDVDVVYSKFFDFNTTQTGKNKWDSTATCIAPGWIAIGGATNAPAYSPYDAALGYGLLSEIGGRYRGGDDNMLADWVSGLELAVDLKAGDYKVTFIQGELSGTAKNVAHAINKAYDADTNTGEALISGKATANSNSYVATSYDLTLAEDTQVVATGDYVMGLVIEANAPATVETFDTALLEQLIADADMDNQTEGDYTVASWEAFVTAYNAAVAALERAPLAKTEGTDAYDALYDAWKGLVLRGGIVSYNIDFGPRVDSSKTDPQLEANGQSATAFANEAVEGAVRPAFQLGHGDMLYTENISDNGLHWGFDRVVDDGNTTNGGAYFRDWVYTGANNEPYTFMADLPTGDYFIFVYNGVKEGDANTTMLTFGNEVLSTTNEATKTTEDGETVYIQQYNTGGQYPYASSIYYVRVEENENALSALPRLKVGTLSITVFDDSNTSTRTGCMNGIEIFPVRLDGAENPAAKTAITIDGFAVSDKTYDATAAVLSSEPVVKDVSGNVIEDAASELTYTYTGTGSTVYESNEAPVNAGTYQLVISADASELYKGTSEPVTFTIAKAPVTVGPSDVIVDLAAEGDVSGNDVSGGDVSGSDVSGSDVSGSDATIPTPVLKYSGLIGDETIEPAAAPVFTHDAGDGKTAGTYTYTWTNSDVSFLNADNYTVTAVPTAQLIIKDADTQLEAQTVTISGVSFGENTYDGLAVAPVGAPVAMAGEKNVTANIESFTYAYTGVGGTVYESSEAPVNAGSYQLVITVTDNDGLYTGTSEAIAFTIAKKAVSVAPKAVTVEAGETLPAFELVYEGLLGEDTLTPSATPTFTTDAADTNTAGTYTITWSNMADVTFGGNDNYVVADNAKTATAVLTITPSTKADKTALAAYVDSVKDLAEADYTAASWTAYKNELTKASEILASDSATQAEVDAALAALTAAKDALVKKADTSALAAYIDSVKDLKAEDYTGDSWNAYQTALAAANAVLAANDPTQAEVDKALADLTAAKDALEKVVVKTELTEYINAVKNENLKEDEYSETSWAAYQTALANANAVLASGTASQAEIDAALATLKTAVAGLVKDDSGSGSGSGSGDNSDSSSDDDSDDSSADTSAGTTTGVSPKTGDNNRIELFAVMTVACAAMFLALLGKKKEVE